LLIGQEGRAQQKFRYAPYIEFLHCSLGAVGEVVEQEAMVAKMLEADKAKPGP
jgi:hypothetical protein